MKKKKYFKRIVGVTSIAIIIMLIILIFLTRATYRSLKDNLEENLMLADKQRVFTLEKQFTFYSTIMKSFGTSIEQASENGIEKDKVKLRILLSDLSSEIGASVMGICDENGKGIIGTDIELDEQEGIKKAIKDKKENISFLENGPQGERECISFVVPLKNDESGKLYVFYATMARELLTNVFNTSIAYKNQKIMLVGEDGSVILPMTDVKVQEKLISELDSLKGKDSSRSKAYNQFISKMNHNGYAIGRFDIGKSEEYIGIVKLESIPWYFISSVPTEETDKYIERSTRSMVILFSIMLLLFLGVIVFIQILHYKNQEKVFELAYYDSKTKLYNWEYLQMRIGEKHALNKKLVLILLDIKGLRYINDLYGYNAGDTVIQDIANYFRENECLLYGKIKDDEFALVIEGDLDDKILKWCKKYISELKKTISKDFEVDIDASIAELEVDDNGNYQKTLDNAYTALEIQKKQGGFNIGVYNQALKEEKLRQKRLENDLIDGIKNKEFMVYFQPKYDAKTEKLVGAEALVRWQHPEFGFLGPGQFIPIFENNGTIGKIDMYVLEEVCRRIKEWKNKYNNIPIISINLSRAEINDRNLIKTINKIRNRYDIDSDLIELEITESSLSSNEEKLVSISRKLHKAGFSLAIDDFGTGYSSLAQLLKMPLDTLKLDKSFLDSYEKEGDGSNVHVFICDVIQIAKHINCSVVAEGVETKIQRDMLADAGCDIIQGYYYGKPMPEDEFSKLLVEDCA